MEKAQLRRVMPFVCLIGGGALVLANSSSVLAAASTFRNVSPIPVLIGIALSAVAMVNRGQLNSAAQRSVGLTASRYEMFRLSTVAFAANKVLKSAGVAGLFLFSRHAKRARVATADVMSACVIAAIASFTALVLFVVASFVALAATQSLTTPWTAAAAAFGFLALGVTITVATVLTHPNGVDPWVRRLLRRRDRVFRRASDPGAIDALAISTVGQIARLRDARSPARVLRHAIESKLCGAAMLLVATVAVGHGLDPVTVLVIYTTALLASLVAFLPGGVGAVEASAVAMLVTSGMPVPQALVAVTLFRVFDMWIPVATGFVLGRSELRAIQEDRDASLPLALAA